MNPRILGWAVWSGVLCLRLHTSGGLLWTLQWTFGFHKMVNFLVIEILLSSLEGLEPMKWARGTLCLRGCNCVKINLCPCQELNQGHSDRIRSPCSLRHLEQCTGVQHFCCVAIWKVGFYQKPWVTCFIGHLMYFISCRLFTIKWNWCKEENHI
jgi:hypothetical protein